MRRSHSRHTPLPARRALTAAGGLLTAAVLTAGLASPAVAAPAQMLPPVPGLAPAAAEQITALQQLKRSQTGAETRIDSRLLLADRQSRGRVAPGAAAIDPGLVENGDGRVAGVGTKICVLADGVDTLTTSQADGQLPAVDVLPGNAGFGTEGTAMLEIIHDLAPGAELGFATAFISDASFADNIRALRSQSGCDVIVDDVFYLDESPFQDDVIARAVNDVTADGALFFSSAGNDGNTLESTSGHGEGDFVAAADGRTHDFDAGAGVQGVNPLSPYSVGIPVTLFWSDPLGGAANDYDLYVVNGAGRVLAFSQNVQNGTQDPYELLLTPFGDETDSRVVVVKSAGVDRYLAVSTVFGRFADAGTVRGFTTPGVIRGHPGRHARGQRRRRPRRAGPRPAGAGRPGRSDRPVPRHVLRGQRTGAVHLRRPATDLLQPGRCRCAATATATAGPSRSAPPSPPPPPGWW